MIKQIQTEQEADKKNFLTQQKREYKVNKEQIKKVRLRFILENMPMQYKENFSAIKIEKFIEKVLIFSIFLLKTWIVGTG